MNIASIIERLDYWKLVYEQAADIETKTRARLGVEECADLLKEAALEDAE